MLSVLSSYMHSHMNRPRNNCFLCWIQSSSPVQRRGHLPQKHMGQPGFDEMGSDGRWDLWRGLPALRSNYGCGGISKQQKGEAAHIFSLFFNVGMNIQQKTENF